MVHNHLKILILESQLVKVPTENPSGKFQWEEVPTEERKSKKSVGKTPENAENF